VIKFLKRLNFFHISHNIDIKTLIIFTPIKDNYICNGNAALLKVIGSLPPLLSVLVEIYFSLVGWVVAYNARGDISFFGGKTCSTVTHIYQYSIGGLKDIKVHVYYNRYSFLFINSIYLH
jgi:hypothetical protein